MDLDRGSIVVVEIMDMTHEGKGVGRTEGGLAVFVEGALVGDVVEAKIVKMKKSFAEAKVMKIAEKSPFRVESGCDVSEMCGGCDYQELDYDKQLELKQKKVQDAINKLAKLDMDVERIVHPKNLDFYRNKVTLHVDYGDDVKVGYYERGSHSVIDLGSCNINSEISRNVADIVKTWLEQSGTKSIEHILVRDSKRTGDAMVVLVSKVENVENIESLAKELRTRFPEIKTVVQNINPKRGKITLGRKNRVLFGEGYIYDYVGDLKFKISPETFFQVNTDGMELLYELAIEYAGLTGQEHVYDIYCGIGTITLALAEKASVVYGVEIVEKSIENAKENANLNGIENTKFYTGKAEEVVPRLYGEGKKADVVVIDPPRKGCEQIVLDTIVEASPKRVVYVSCNPATMARDISHLVENGYEVKVVQPVDMFPMTAHVEAVCLLEWKV